MQKIAKNSLFSAVIRGIITGVVALVVFISGLYGASVYAQNNPGGKFGEVLNAILSSNNWQSPTGTVKNADRLGGVEASAFLQKKSVDQECGKDQCIVGFRSDGAIICE